MNIYNKINNMHLFMQMWIFLWNITFNVWIDQIYVFKSQKFLQFIELNICFSNPWAKPQDMQILTLIGVQWQIAYSNCLLSI